MHLLSHKVWEKIQEASTYIKLSIRLISCVYYTVLCSSYSGHTEIRWRNFIKRLKLNYFAGLLCLRVCFVKSSVVCLGIFC